MTIVDQVEVHDEAPVLRRPVPFAFAKSRSNEKCVGYALGCEDSAYVALFLAALIVVGSCVILLPIVFREGLFAPVYDEYGSIPVVLYLLIPVVFVVFGVVMTWVILSRTQVVVHKESGEVQFQDGLMKSSPPVKGSIVLSEAFMVSSNKRWFQTGKIFPGNALVFVVAIKGGTKCEAIGVSFLNIEGAKLARALADRLHDETGFSVHVNQNPECTVVEGKALVASKTQDLIFANPERNRFWGKIAFKS